MQTTNITAQNIAATDTQRPQAGWRLYLWAKELPCSKDQAIDWIAEGVLPAAKVGGATFILISPTDFLHKHRVRVGDSN